MINMIMKEVIKWVLVFTVLNILFLVAGQFILFFLTDTNGVLCSMFYYFNSWLTYLGTVFFQCFLFLIITLLTIKWIYKKHYYLVFPTILLLLFNAVFFAVFFLNIEFVDSKTFNSFAHNCFSYSANIIADFLYCKISLYGIYDGGFFAPDNTIYAYILLVVIPFIYFSILTCLCSFIVREKLTN